MDKYTVDLDQVLNDFEYSELTDQHSKNVAERMQSNVSFQAPPVTKHSINNVFHSLNEYLNSGINHGKGGTSYVPENIAKELGVNDNKIDYNPVQTFSKTEDIQNNLTESIKNNLVELPESLNQSEQITFQDSNGYDEKSNVELNLPIQSGKLLDIDVTVTENNVNQVKSITETCSSTNEEHPNFVNPETSTEQIIGLRSDYFEKSNVDSIKTETFNFLLPDTGQAEAQLIPELNCMGSSKEKESNNVHIDLECDRSVLDKADSVLGKDEANFGGNESYSEVKDVIEKVTVNNTEINEDSDDVNKKSIPILVNIEDDDIQNVDSSSKLENLVIEVSESPYPGSYAIGEADHLTQAPENATKKEIQPIDEVHDQPKNEILTKSNENASLEKDHDAEASKDDSLDSNQSSLLPEDSVNLKTTATNNDEADSDRNEEFQTPIGFSTDIDIDESELHKMLEDLELEEDMSNPEDNASGEHASKDRADEIKVTSEPQRVENNEIETKEQDNSIKIMPDSESVEEVTTETQIISSDVKASSNAQPTSNNLSEENAESEEKTIPLQIECLELEKPRKNKKSSKNKIQSDQSEESTTTVQYTQEILEDQFEHIEQEVKNEELALEKDQPQEVVSRPQNLPLNNEVKDDNVGRKINLIGSPGSTPYNNVYINKSIEPKSTQDTESDYTSSASPTFSDCSTESTSTASTVSVENVLNNADKFTKKTTGVKNTNLEGGSNALSGVQDVPARVEDRDDSLTQNGSADGQTVEKKSVGIQEETAVNESENIATNSEISAGDSQMQSSQSSDTFLDKSWLGKEAPLWIPDADAASCLHCDMKFTVLKRRHHCRACGLVLCSKCCNLKFKLEYLEAEARVCNKCHNILNKDVPNNAGSNHDSPESNSLAFRPNPNNPLEYCSTVSPLQQAGQAGAHPPSVMVPVGVLKRKGSNKKSNKSVMFCDGIAPGSDLTHLDQDFNYNSDSKTPKSLQKTPDEVKKKEESVPPPSVVPTAKASRNQPKIDQETGCFIPKSETSLPPTVSVNKTDILYSDCSNAPSVVEMLKNEALLFAINQNLFVHVKVINMNCCINKQAWCFCTEGLINVGSDEVVYLIEYIEEESFVPKDVFFHIQNVYMDAVRGTSVKELGLSLHNTSNFLDSRNHAGFVYIKSTFQCLENVIVPKEPYLIGILIHRWETPWAKLFPLRLILRLGAEYRYYPSPLISTRHRDSVFVEIGHTIINLLADFRNFTYTLPQIRGLIIHMEDKKTTVTIPKNRYDQVMKSINNSSEHILAFAGNFSPEADSHLVCIQDTQGHENCYTTHAINIHNKPRKVTGASFIVFNGSLKSSTGLTAKSNIVEDGLMIQIPSEHLERIRENLRNMKNHTIACGCINATTDETVNILWGENDADFNVGVKSPVDLSDMRGIPSIRVHNGKDYFCNNGARLIRWTEVFILQNGEENPKNQDPLDISKISESVAKASCTALVKYLDLLVSNSCQKIGIRTTLHVENVSYSAGSNGLKLPPIYMRSLDNELVPVLHRITSNNLGDNAIVLELIFRILNA